jgi:beta-lactam-binding protein with PASTA domain
MLFFAMLGWLTNHGEYQKVPGVVGQNIESAKKILEAKGLKVEVQDSVYIDTAAKLSVIRQVPEADATVKNNRTVYLTINRAVAPLSVVPNMIGFSFRSAEMMLQSLSLKLGDTSYKPDIAKNSVLEQLYEGKPITAGTKIPMGSTISFILGSGLGSAELQVPENIIGMTLSQAKDFLATLNINIGAIIPSDLAGNDNAFVYKTNPSRYSETTPGTINKIRPGQLLDLYVTTTAPVKDTSAAPQTP